MTTNCEGQASGEHITDERGCSSCERDGLFWSDALGDWYCPVCKATLQKALRCRRDRA